MGVSDGGVYSRQAYSREVLTTVLVYHQRKNIESCCCGWAKWGASHAEHVADVYEDSLRFMQKGEL